MRDEMQGTPSRFRKYGWVRATLFVLLILLIFGIAGHIVTFTPADVINLADRLTDANYPRALPSFRRAHMRHLANQTYLDYTGAGVYSDLDVHEFRIAALFPAEVPANMTDSADRNVTEEARRELLRFLGTDASHYSVVFVASATQALKLVGEHYPWTSKSKYVYTKFNHNSVLGIRRFAVRNGASFGVVEDSSKIVADSDVLYAVSLEENFAGRKIGISEMRRLTHTEGIEVIADTAAFLPTNRLNLSDTPFHACVLSFYKIMGFPNFGALVIRSDFAKKLVKKTFSSNSAKVSFASVNEFVLDDEKAFGLEDDAVSIEMVKAALNGLRALEKIGIDRINEHVWNLTKKLYNWISSLSHATGEKASEVYGNHNMDDPDMQGGIVAFNMKRSQNEYYGYAKVVGKARKANIHLRGGCHCNPGACFTAVGLSESQVEQYFDKKTTCGDNNDIVNGIPLGSVRASLGWASTEADIDYFVKWLAENFVE